MAISRDGEVLSTSCIAVGGRLMAMDSEIRIRQLADPAIKVMQDIGLSYRLGDRIPKPDIEKIATRMAEVLIEVMRAQRGLLCPKTHDDRRPGFLYTHR